MKRPARSPPSRTEPKKIDQRTFVVEVVRPSSLDNAGEVVVKIRPGDNVTLDDLGVQLPESVMEIITKMLVDMVHEEERAKGQGPGRHVVDGDAA